MSSSIELAETICALKRLAHEAETLARTPGQYSARLAATFKQIAATALDGVMQSTDEMVPARQAEPKGKQ